MEELKKFMEDESTGNFKETVDKIGKEDTVKFLSGLEKDDFKKYMYFFIDECLAINDDNVEGEDYLLYLKEAKGDETYNQIMDEIKTEL